jgi:hypothetical protein
MYRHNWLRTDREERYHQHQCGPASTYSGPTISIPVLVVAGAASCIPRTKVPPRCSCGGLRSSGSHVTGVVFTSHGPAEFGGLAPVRLLQSRAGEGGLGRSKGGGTSHKGGDDGKFGLSR